jgi:hypothetical protein
MKKNLFAVLICLTLLGCEKSTRSVINTLEPARFEIVSSDYATIPSSAENFCLTVLKDTKGTNDLIVVTTPNGGVGLMYIPKPIKHFNLEDIK